MFQEEEQRKKSFIFMHIVGYKIPTSEVLSGIDYTTTSPELLWEPGSVIENSNSFSRKQTPPGLLREPGSAADIDYRTTLSGLLRSRAPSSMLIAGKPHPDSYGSQTSPLTLTAGKLRPDSYGSRASSSTPTAARQTATGILREPDGL